MALEQQQIRDGIDATCNTLQQEGLQALLGNLNFTNLPNTTTILGELRQVCVCVCVCVHVFECLVCICTCPENVKIYIPVCAKATQLLSDLAVEFIRTQPAFLDTFVPALLGSINTSALNVSNATLQEITAILGNSSSASLRLLYSYYNFYTPIRLPMSLLMGSHAAVSNDDARVAIVIILQRDAGATNTTATAVAAGLVALSTPAETLGVWSAYCVHAYCFGLREPWHTLA
jgi:hypothetical protein